MYLTCRKKKLQFNIQRQLKFFSHKQFFSCRLVLVYTSCFHKRYIFLGSWVKVMFCSSMLLWWYGLVFYSSKKNSWSQIASWPPGIWILFNIQILPRRANYINILKEKKLLIIIFHTRVLSKFWCKWTVLANILYKQEVSFLSLS